MKKTFLFLLIPIILGSVAWAWWTKQQHVELKAKTDQLTLELDNAYQIIKEENNVIIQDLKWEAEAIMLAYKSEYSTRYVTKVCGLLDTVGLFNNGEASREILRPVYDYLKNWTFKATPYDTTLIAPLLSRQLLNNLQYPVLTFCDGCTFHWHTSLILTGQPLDQLQITEGDTLRIQINYVHNALFLQPIFELVAVNNIRPTGRMEGIFEMVVPDYIPGGDNIHLAPIEPRIKNLMTQEILPRYFMKGVKYEVLPKENKQSGLEN